MDQTKQIEQLTSALGISLIDQLEAALNADDIAILQDFLCWKRTRFLSQGFSEADVSDLFSTIRGTFSEGMENPIGKRASRFIDEAIRFLDCEKNSPKMVESKLGDVSNQYRELLLDGDRQRASKLILDEAASNTSIQDIYTHVFQNSLYEIGRLWQTNQITIAQEHFFTAATQMIMSQLYPYMFSNNKNGLKMVAASVDSNMHDIGIRMVADFFEMAGWDTYYLGGNAPYEAIMQGLEEKTPHLLALSVTIANQVCIVKDVIKSIRSSEQFDGIKVIVGGRPFNIADGLWKKVGSDGYAKTPEEAVALAKTLINQGGNG